MTKLKVLYFVLYLDTDSVIFKRDVSYTNTLGDFLGEFTNEIDTMKRNHIIEFVSGCPKNYSYRLDAEITYSKIKGFSLISAASKKILKISILVYCFLSLPSLK